MLESTTRKDAHVCVRVGWRSMAPRMKGSRVALSGEFTSVARRRYDDDTCFNARCSKEHSRAICFHDLLL